MKNEDFHKSTFHSDDPFYSKALEPQYDANWESISLQEFKEFAEVMQNTKIMGIEPVVDGKDVTGVILYLKKGNNKFVVSFHAPDLWDDENELYINICCE